jgi:glutathione S-transferase
LRRSAQISSGIAKKNLNQNIMTQLIVYGTPVSTYVRTVRLLLETIGTGYDLQSIDIFNGENHAAEYLIKHPFGKVPTLGIDGKLLYETAAITQYLDTTLADHQFTPSDPWLAAQMQQIMGIIDSYLYTPVITNIVTQRLIVPSQGGITDEDKVKNAIALAQKATEAIEAIIRGGLYLIGGKLSIADFYLIPIFFYLSQTPEFTMIVAQSPKLILWWNAAKESPTVKKICG